MQGMEGSAETQAQWCPLHNCLRWFAGCGRRCGVAETRCLTLAVGGKWSLQRARQGGGGQRRLR